MDKIFSTIGGCTVVFFIIFLIKIITNTLIIRSESNKTYKFDEDDEDE